MGNLKSSSVRNTPFSCELIFVPVRPLPMTSPINKKNSPGFCVLRDHQVTVVATYRPGGLAVVVELPTIQPKARIG
jgi:hypothetical protein